MAIIDIVKCDIVDGEFSGHVIGIGVNPKSWTG